ncbi:sigma-70 family RNA polymerase sigma factor [Glycomyces terrestris]|uniref:Sigma-70 family RNA polymerase sigma factor n=1 Tax=Glycomyces terrestris TaxID=2493553 RepID=A0A426V330_9ACTN|nr:sigma-70 family RNA polymerase sigma factor [Glycomyces terrestris]RRS01272.1 sigma-70 family RNA polymerase sigma factor [Glycomyces terrestris]
MAPEHDPEHDDTPDAPATHRPQDPYRELRPLFERMAALDDDDPARAALRERLVTGFLPLAEHVARRYALAGAGHDDLVRVAVQGLARVIERFDPALGKDFLSFAVPAIMGDVRRHLRDTAWPGRLPAHSREPDPATADAAAGPPEAPFHADTGGVSMAETARFEDLALRLADDPDALVPLLRQLPMREQRILALRFFEFKTQAQIAAEVGLPPARVAHLLEQTLTALRERIDARTDPRREATKRP